jgi:hypothetical protein
MVGIVNEARPGTAQATARYFECSELTLHHAKLWDTVCTHKRFAGSSINSTPGAVRSNARTSSGSIGNSVSSTIDSECARSVGTRTAVHETYAIAAVRQSTGAQRFYPSTHAIVLFPYVNAKCAK